MPINKWGAEVEDKHITNKKPRRKFKVGDIVQYNGPEESLVDFLLILKAEHQLVPDYDRKPSHKKHMWRIEYTVIPLQTTVSEGIDIVTDENLDYYKVVA